MLAFFVRIIGKGTKRQKFDAISNNFKIRSLIYPERIVILTIGKRRCKLWSLPWKTT